jgi:hypothetical protein
MQNAAGHSPVVAKSPGINLSISEIRQSYWSPSLSAEVLQTLRLTTVAIQESVSAET